MPQPIQLPLLHSVQQPKPSDTAHHDTDKRINNSSRAPSDEGRENFDQALESADQSRHQAETAETKADVEASNRADVAEESYTDGNELPTLATNDETIGTTVALGLTAKQSSTDDALNFQIGIEQSTKDLVDTAVFFAGRLLGDALQSTAQSSGSGVATGYAPAVAQPNLLTRLQSIVAQAGIPLNVDAESVEVESFSLGTELDLAKSVASAVKGEADTDHQRALHTSLADNKHTLPGAKTELTVPVKVGTDGWSDAMAGRINMLINQRVSSARIHITPPDLGPIEVRINLNSDQASVQFSSPSAQVRDALEQSIPRLRDMLESAGFSLADSDVNDQGSNHHGDEPDAGEDGGMESADDTSDSVVRRETLGLVDDFV